MSGSPGPAHSWCVHFAGLILLWLCIALPIAWVVSYCLLYSLGIGSLLSNGTTLHHWQSALEAGRLKESLVYSLSIAGASTVLAVAGSLGFTLACPQVGNNPRVLATLCIPLATPSAVMAVMTYQILNPGGYLSRIAFHWGWIETPTQFPVLVNDRFSIGIIIAHVCGMAPLLLMFFLKTWNSCRVDKYCRLAESLGASVLQTRLKVALPMLLKRARMLILLLFLVILGSYEVPLLLGQQSPQMFSVMTQRHAGQFNLDERPQSFVLATCYFLVVGAGVYAMMKWRHDDANQQ